MCDGMIMTPAILAPMRAIFSRQARTGTRQHRNRIDHKFRYERPKKKKVVKFRYFNTRTTYTFAPFNMMSLCVTKASRAISFRFRRQPQNLAGPTAISVPQKKKKKT
jgi:hypothetical protein